MREYPKHINTKQDFDNLLADERFKAQALADMKKLKAQIEAESKIIRVVSGSEKEGNLVTEQIDNPSPRHLKMGFKNKAELDSVVIAKEADLDGK